MIEFATTDVFSVYFVVVTAKPSEYMLLIIHVAYSKPIIEGDKTTRTRPDHG
jgi:hypothetical protein